MGSLASGLSVDKVVLCTSLSHVLQTISSAGEVAQGAHRTAEANLMSAKQEQVYAQSQKDRASMLKEEANSVALQRIQGNLLGCAHSRHFK